MGVSWTVSLSPVIFLHANEGVGRARMEKNHRVSFRPVYPCGRVVGEIGIWTSDELWSDFRGHGS